MEHQTIAARITAVATLLAMLALPLAAIAILRLFPPLQPSLIGAPWLVPGAHGLAAVATGIATLACLAAAMRDGRPPDLIAAAAMGLITGALAAEALGSRVLGAGALASAVLLLTAGIADRLPLLIPAGRDRLLAAAAALIWVEAGLAVMVLLVGPWSGLAPWREPILFAASGFAAGAALLAARSWPMALAWLAVGLDALAFARLGSVELLAGLSAVGAGAIVLARAARERVEEPRALLTRAEDRLPELAGGLTDGVLLFDSRLRLRDWNTAASALFELRSEAVGSRLEELLGISLPALQRPGPRPLIDAAGVPGQVELMPVPVVDGIVVVAREIGGSPELRLEAERLGRELRGTIEELLRARRTIDLQRVELEQAAVIDPLTGVMSRAAIMDRLRTEVAEARRYAHPVAAVLIDVDGFTELNRLYGMAAGDSLLREVALRLRLRIRAADALGRSSGDAFLAILPHTFEGRASTFAEALRQRLAQRPFPAGEQEVRITVSIGIAIMQPGEELDADALMARATSALERAREAGGDRVAVDQGPESLPRPADRNQGGAGTQRSGSGS